MGKEGNYRRGRRVRRGGGGRKAGNLTQGHKGTKFRMLWGKLTVCKLTLPTDVGSKELSRKCPL